MESVTVRRLIFLMTFVLFLAACAANSPEVPQEANTAVSPTNTIQNPTPTLAEIVTETAVPQNTPITKSTATNLPLTMTPTGTTTATAEPIPTEPLPTPESIIEVAGATVPPGFSLIKFADLYRPTSLAFDATGRLYVTAFDGTVHVLQDKDGDGRSDSDIVFANGFSTALGITVRPGTNDVYVSSNSQITLLRDENGDDRTDIREVVVSGLPTGLHQNDNLKFGSDGWLYMGVGSTCDACTELDSRSASLMRFNVDTGESEVIATGLRNPYDIAFHPTTGDLFATDNGRDDLGLDSPFEELNHIISGGDYGWPNCWDEGEGNDCDGTETAVAFFEPHSSANGLDFYSGSQFPPEYKNNAFVTIFGTFLTDGVQTGVARVQLTPDGDSYQSSVSWFAQWPDGRPLPLIVGPDGALYVGDYINDAIYRISYGK